MAAIQVIQICEAEDRQPSDEERSALARYNGWGGLPRVFDAYREQEGLEEGSPGWWREAQRQLKEILPGPLYNSARESVNNAHYTPPEVVRAIWGAVQELGFKGGRVLEPAMGIGNFLGLSPAGIVERSRFVGIEKDELAGRMAKLLYPDADIRVQGFEQANLPKAFFDLVVTNVPFGDYSVYDQAYDHLRLPIHDYFLVKALDHLKPGGIAACITSSYTLDKVGTKARRLLAERGQFLGAVRLPDNAQLAQAGTSVTTDILFFRRRTDRPGLDETPPAWVESEERPFVEKGGENHRFLPISRYYLDHPDHVLGRMVAGRGDRGRFRLVAEPGERPLEEILPASLAQILRESVAPAPIDDGPPESQDGQQQAQVINDFGDRSAGAYVLHEDGRVYQVQGDGITAVAVALEGQDLERLVAFINVRDAMDEVFRVQIDHSDDSPQARRLLKEAQAELGRAYDSFVEVHGPLNLPMNRRYFAEDPECGRVMALEVYDEKHKTAAKADVFHARVVAVPRRVTSVDTLREALLVCLDRTGQVDLSVIGALYGATPQEVTRKLTEDREIFHDPECNQWLPAARYLSGDVRAKLKAAEDAAVIDPAYASNVQALREVQPKDLEPKDIEVRLGAPWIPAEDVRAFALDVLDLADYVDIEIKYRKLTGDWIVNIGKRYAASLKATSVWGTDRRPFADILERSLNQQSLNVYDQTNDGGRVLNMQETLAAQEKLDAIQVKFRQWIWESDPDRADRLLRAYNDTYNCYIPPTYDGSHMSFPGMSLAMKPRPSQKNAVYRSLMEGNTLFAHEVGCGKTLCQAAAAMEKKRLGKASKPGWIVPNHMLEQAEREARQLYPGKRIIAIRKQDLSQEKRAKFLGRVANNNWDLVIMTHKVFERIGVKPEFEERFLGDQLTKLRMELEGIDVEDKKSRKKYGVKKIEQAIKTLATRIKRLQDAERDEGIHFEDLGIDSLEVDEAHKFKNLAIHTSQSEVSQGIQGSSRAWHLYMVLNWLYERRGSVSGVDFATGTPISNNILETFNVQRYLQPDLLDRKGLSSASAWSAMFLRPKQAWEPSPSGSGWKLRTRYALINVPELMQSLRQTMDVVTAESAGVKRPESVRENVACEMSGIQKRLMSGLAKRVKKIQSGRVDPSLDNLLKIVSEGRKLGLDPRLLDPSLPDNPASKINACCQNVFALWQACASTRGTQLIFSDLGTPGERKSFNVYDDIREKLVVLGVPKAEMAFIHEHDSDEAKAQLFQRVRDGDVRVLLGSTEKMGEGTNVQDRIVAVHHLDPPWRPSDIEQRDGRAVRYGNQNDQVRRFIYTTTGSFDLFMWATLKYKAETFARVLKGDPSVRTLDMEVDPTYAETAAIATNNPLIKEKLEVDHAISRIEMLVKSASQEIHRLNRLIKAYEQDKGSYRASLKQYEDIPDVNVRVPEWYLDLRPYGHDSEFKGEDRHKFLELLSKLMNTHKIATVDGIQCCGVPVSLSRVLDLETDKAQMVWTIGKGPLALTRFKAFDVEDVIFNKGRKIQHIKNVLDDYDKKIVEAQGLLGASKSHDEELLELYARRREILEKIEMHQNEELEDDEIDLIAEEDSVEEVVPASCGLSM